MGQELKALKRYNTKDFEDKIRLRNGIDLYLRSDVDPMISALKAQVDELRGALEMIYNLEIACAGAVDNVTKDSCDVMHDIAKEHTGNKGD